VTDPQNPNDPARPPVSPVPPAPAYGQQPPAYGQPPAAAPQYGQQQPYSAAPPPAYGPPATSTVPGRTMGIVAFILSFFVQLIALILGIIALSQSKKAGHKNPWALGAIIISASLLVLGIIVLIVFFTVIAPQIAETADEILRQCQELGAGVQEINGIPIDCTQILNQ